MNKGFKFYYKDGLRKARKEFKKKKNFGKFYAYLFSSLIGRLILFLFMPAFSLSDYKLTMMVKDGEDISLSKTYEAMDNPKTFWTCILAGLNTALVFLGGLLLILFPTAILFGIGYLIAYIISNPNLALVLPIALASPGALALVIYLIIFPFYIAPLYYIISKVNGVNATDAMKNSFKAMKEGKGTLFLLALVHGLVLSLLLAFVGVIAYVGIMFLPQYLAQASIIPANRIVMVRGIGALLSLVPLVLLIRFLPVRICALGVANIELFDDILVRYNDSLQGIYYKGVKVEKVSYKNYKENIVKLFEETKNYSEYVEPKQEDVEVVKESTKEEIQEEYLDNEKKIEKMAAQVQEEKASETKEVEKPLSKKEQKALEKQEKKNKKNKAKEEKAIVEEDETKIEETTDPELQEKENVTPIPQVHEEPKEVHEEPKKVEEPKEVEEPQVEEETQKVVQEEKPDFHQEYDNEEDEPIFTDEAETPDVSEEETSAEEKPIEEEPVEEPQEEEAPQEVHEEVEPEPEVEPEVVEETTETEETLAEDESDETKEE